jgi:hypothetical protein
MKTKKASEKDMGIVYRKDGKTPDRRYKRSKDFAVTQNPGKSKKQTTEVKTPEFQYKRFRDNAISRQTEKIKIDTVQIKPVGKKPLWKVSG